MKYLVTKKRMVVIELILYFFNKKVNPTFFLKKNKHFYGLFGFSNIIFDYLHS